MPKLHVPHQLLLVGREAARQKAADEVEAMRMQQQILAWEASAEGKRSGNLPCLTHRCVIACSTAVPLLLLYSCVCTLIDVNQLIIPMSFAEKNATDHARPVQTMCRWHASRAELPVGQIRQGLIQALDKHDVALVCGDTGCGKTTQV